MPLTRQDDRWSDRIARWLAGERGLAAGDAQAVAATVVEAMRADWASRPGDLDAARATVLRQIGVLDELRAGLQRLVDRIDAQARLAARQEQFGARWRDQQVASLQAARQVSPEMAGQFWHRAWAEALAEWALDACEWLIESGEAYAGREQRDRLARCLAALRDQPTVEVVACLDSSIAAAGQGGAPVSETAQRLLVLQARVLMHDLNDLDQAEAALELASEGPHGAARAIVYVGWGELLLLQDRLSDAQAAFEHAVAVAPELVDACVGYGVVAGRLDRWEDADLWFGRAIERALDEADPLLALQRLRLRCPGRLWLRLAAVPGAGGEEATLARIDDLALTSEPAGVSPTMRAEALERRARRRASTGDVAAAAADLKDAAGELNDADAARSAALYEEADRLAPDDPGTHWYWADALHVASYRPEPPYADAPTLERAVDVWNRGAAIGLPAPPYGWAYLARALIAERQTRLDEAGREALLWQAVAWTESALLLELGGAQVWSTLCRLHRALGNDKCALEASGRGFELWPSNLSTLEERVIMLVNTRRHEEARALMPQWRDLGGSGAWIDAVEAHLIVNGTGGHEPDLLRRALELTERSPDEPWPWMFRNRARAWLRLGDIEAARGEWRRMLGHREATTPDDWPEIAFALSVVGRHDEVLDIVRLMLAEQPTQRDAAIRIEVATRLLRGGEGDVESALNLLPGAFSRAPRRVVEDWLEGDALELLALLEADAATTPDQRELYARIVSAANQALTASRRTDTPAAELRGLLESDPGRYAPGSGFRRGLVASLARVQRAGQRFAEALEHYRELLSEGGGPWLDGIDATLQDWIAAGERAEAAAVAVWSDALATVARLDLPHVPAALRLHALLALAECSSRDACARHLSPAIDALADAPAPSAADLVAALEDRLADAEAIWSLDDALALLERDSGDRRRAVCRQARDALLRPLEAVLRLSADAARTSAYSLSTTTLGIYLGGGLYDQAMEAELPTRGWVALQERVLAKTGVELPDVALHDSSADALLDQGYLLTKDDVALFQGRVREGERFSPQSRDELVALGIAPALLSPAADPRATGSQGAWLASGGWDRAVVAGIELWADETAFLIEEVGAVVQTVLGELIGVDEAVRWLKRSDPTPSTALAAQCRRVFAEPAELHRLARLLQALASEQVPIADRQTIVDALRAGRGEGFDALLSRARRPVVAGLPGATAATPAVSLPADTENDLRAWFVVERGRGYIAMPPDETHELIDTLRFLLAEIGDRGALVVGQAEIRSALRRVTLLEHPHLAVVTAEERAEGSRGVAVPVTESAR